MVPVGRNCQPERSQPRGVRAVTIVVADVTASLRLYGDLLGFELVEDVRAAGPGAAVLREAWGLPPGDALRVATLLARGARDGAVRLVQPAPAERACVTDGARPWDHGYIKNLDVFTDDVHALARRAVSLGYPCLSDPFTYPLPWGPRVTATEAHVPAGDGVKVAFARMDGAPRRAFGEAARSAPCTEIAAATRIVDDYDAAVAFARDVLDCVPAHETVVEDPGLVTGLSLPPQTRLRLSFIGPPAAVGGKLGLVAYEGPHIGDRGPLLATAPPGARGARVLTFDDDEIRSRGSRAVVHGATWVRRPSNLQWVDGTTWCQSAVRLPDGLVLEFVSPPLDADPPGVDVGAAASLHEGRLLGVRVPRLGRVLLARIRGEVFAIEDRCPHAGGPLSAGALTGVEAICPWHAWRIDVTNGRVRDGCGTVRRLAVAERGGRLLVRPASAEARAAR